MKTKKGLALLLAAAMAVSSFAGCKNNAASDEQSTPQQQQSQQQSSSAEQQSESKTAPATKLSILAPYGSNEYDDNEYFLEWINDIQKMTNTELSWEFYDSNSYYEKLTLKYATGELASIMVTDKNAEFLNASKYNVFWELSNYLDLFNNLSVIPDAVRENASANGELYGIPRSRNLGRNAWAYRQDWADNLGLGHPETLEDLYEMAVAFTNNDPDGNGKNDTYGFAFDGWTGMWTMMMMWFGVPNVWGIDENGDLEYYAMTEEYLTALKWFRQIYSEGLLPSDFRYIKAGDADKQLLRTNMCGIVGQVAEIPRKAQEAMVGSEEAPGLYPEARFTYFTGVDAGYGINTYPTAGYAGLVSITKQYVKTEDELMGALAFLNATGNADVQMLMYSGYEGKDYYVDENGYKVVYSADEKTAMGYSAPNYREGWGQIIPFWSCEEEAAKIPQIEAASDIRKAEAAIKAENEKHVVANYGASYSSETYVNIGADLDDIINTSLLDYIEGKIDDVGLQSQLKQWWEAGGETVTAEMNALYHQYK